MKQLENILTLDGGHTATLVKRNDKAAIYRRETAEGQFVSFEVFAIMTKDGAEIYPNQKAVQNRWCTCPTSEAKANTWFDRFVNGEVVIPNVDPVTGEPLEVADNRSLDELPDVNVSVDIPAPVVVVTDISPEGAVDNPIILPAVDTTEIVSVPVDSVPAVEVPAVEDPTAPDEVPTVEVPEVEVTPTVDGGMAVTVAKVVKTKVLPTYNFPTKAEWLRDDFAELNGMDHHPAHSDSYGPLMALIKAGKVREVKKAVVGKGRPRSFYAVVPTV